MKKKVWLIGGVGNNFFQFLLGEYLRDQGCQIRYVTNLVQENVITRNLLKWQIHEPLYREILLEDECENQKLIQSISSIFLFYMSKLLGKSFLGYAYDLPGINARFFLGYYQKPEYLFLFRNQIAKIRNNVVSKLPKSQVFSEVIHFRGKDTLNLKSNIYYLKRALELYPDIKVVTDDLKLCRKHVSPKTEVISNTAFIDFAILVSAENALICSDSTFSFWAGIFNEKAIVYAPQSLIENLGSYQGKIKPIP